MKKLLSVLCLTVLLGLFAGIANAKSFCPSYFDQNKSFAENIEITTDTQWVLFKEMPYELNKTTSSYTLSSLGYYSNSSADPNLEFEIRVDKKDFNVNESSYYSWMKSQTITKDIAPWICSYSTIIPTKAPMTGSTCKI